MEAEKSTIGPSAGSVAVEGLDPALSDEATYPPKCSNRQAPMRYGAEPIHAEEVSVSIPINPVARAAHVMLDSGQVGQNGLEDMLRATAVIAASAQVQYPDRASRR